MKSFILALILLSSVTVFVSFNAHRTVSRIDEMLEIAATLPKNEKEFELHAQQAQNAVDRLIRCWDESFPTIAFTAGYENTNRCDEAIGELAVHFENQNGLDFTAALSEFCDSLSRLRILEGFHWEGIF